MSSLQVKPPEHYTSLELSEVLRRLAQANGRPDPYPMVVCQAVRHALQTGTDHPMLESVRSMMKRYPRMEPRTNLLRREPPVENIKASYTPEQLVKVEFIRDWCSLHRGGAKILAGQLDDKLFRMARRVKYEMKFDDELLELTYRYTKSVHDQESKAIEGGLSNSSNQKFFIDLMSIYCHKVVALAYNSIMEGVKDYRINQNCLVGEFVEIDSMRGFGYVVDKRIRLLRLLHELGLITMPDGNISKSTSRFKLVDGNITKQLYKLAFEGVAYWCKQDRYKTRMVNIKASPLVKSVHANLIDYVIHVYGLSPNMNKRTAA